MRKKVIKLIRQILMILNFIIKCQIQNQKLSEKEFRGRVKLNRNLRIKSRAHKNKKERSNCKIYTEATMEIIDNEDLYVEKKIINSLNE